MTKVGILITVVIAVAISAASAFGAFSPRTDIIRSAVAVAGVASDTYATDITGDTGVTADAGITDDAEGGVSKDIRAHVSEMTAKHLSVLESLLDKLPDSARAGIERAIEAFGHGHDTAGNHAGGHKADPPNGGGVTGDAGSTDDAGATGDAGAGGVTDDVDGTDDSADKGKGNGPPDHAAANGHSKGSSYGYESRGSQWRARP